MHLPSVSTILLAIFLAYVAHTIWMVAHLFISLECTSSPCYTSYLNTRPRLQLALFTSYHGDPVGTETTKVLNLKHFDYHSAYDAPVEVPIPVRTRRNGTMYLHIVLARDDNVPIDWKRIKRDGPTIIHGVKLTEYMVPKPSAFNLLGESKDQGKTKPTDAASELKPVTHIKAHVYVDLLTDPVSMSHQDVPPEMTHLLRITRDNQILPILQTDFFNTRLKDHVQLERKNKTFTFQIHYRPVSIGKLRLMLMIELAMKKLEYMGFAIRDIDEVKGIFSDTNVYLLCGTILVASVHLLFDFLSFKNDISFWRRKKSYEGLSRSTILWRAFSQAVIFFYLLDEKTSMLVLIPAGLAALIELWKCKKILKLRIGFGGIQRAPEDDAQKIAANAEKKTKEFDKQGMRYLRYILYPLVIGGSVYSLLFQPHRSWYSWTLNSLVNGVYAFGFLFMLPQLFVNYKLKSVAALPWRAFMYKAFNTFIDDFFAIIITMPTAHRVACLRDDVVFLIYLYQRWLYPVDKTRLDTGLAIETTDPVEGTETPVQPEVEQEDKKTK